MYRYLILFLLLFVGCYSTSQSFRSKKYENVHELLMQEYGKYILISLDENNKAETIWLTLNASKHDKFNIYFDLEETDKQYAKIEFLDATENIGNSHCCRTYVQGAEIHLHKKTGRIF